MLKKVMYPYFVEKFPGAEADGLLKYVFDYFDSRHLKGLMDHINDENDDEDLEDDDIGEGYDNGEFYKR
jgi:hypothetical protein